MIKSVAKSTLNALGIDVEQAARRVRNLPFINHLERRRQAQLVTNPAKRREFVLNTVREFNPDISADKPSGIIRAATIWEGAGRFAWLDHANKNLDLELVHLPRAIVSPAWAYWLNDYLTASRNVLHLGEYALDRYYQPRFADAREAFRTYCTHAIGEVVRAFSIDVLIMPKINDDWTIDFINCAKSLGLPVIIDDREGAITPQRLSVVPPRLRELLDVKFDCLCVHNEIHKELFVRSGLPAENIIVNGAPQSDYWSRPDLWKTRKEIHPKLEDDRFLIVFFSFGPRTYLNFYYGEEPRNWASLGADFHKVLVELLAHHGDRIQIVYKSGGKPLRDQFPGYEVFIKEASPYINDRNYIELDGTFSSFDLLNNADTVFGFQTSGMIEAMFLDVPIIYGAWGELFEDIKDTLLPLHNCAGLTYAETREKLYAALELVITSDTPPSLSLRQKSARKAMRESYFAKADGNVSLRLLEQAAYLAKTSIPTHQGAGHKNE